MLPQQELTSARPYAFRLEWDGRVYGAAAVACLKTERVKEPDAITSLKTAGTLKKTSLTLWGATQVTSRFPGQVKVQVNPILTEGSGPKGEQEQKPTISVQPQSAELRNGESIIFTATVNMAEQESEDSGGRQMLVTFSDLSSGRTLSVVQTDADINRGLGCWVKWLICVICLVTLTAVGILVLRRLRR